MKRVFILALTLSLLLSCVPLAAYAQGTTPAGTAITSAAEFKTMTATGTYYLANNIDFDGEAFPNYIIETFSGTLDGQGYKLYNFSITANAEKTYGGVFGTVADDGATTIKNLQIGASGANIQMAPSYTGSGNGYIGGVVGLHNNSNNLTMSNVTVYADLKVPFVKGNFYHGGLIGYASNVDMTNCQMNGSIYAQPTRVDKNSETLVGGLVGVMWGNGTITNCINNAKIEIVQYNNNVYSGGIMALAGTKNITFSNCVNMGDIEIVDIEGTRHLSAGALGGIAGRARLAEGVFNNCVNMGSILINTQPSGATTAYYYGGITGRNQTASGTYTNCINYGSLTNENNTGTKGGIYGITGDGNTFTGCFDATATPDANPATATVGIQEKAGANNTLDVRFVASVDSLDHQNVGVAGVAYWIEDGQVKTWSFRYNCQTVYKSIQASVNDTTVEYAATDHGGNYLMALTIAGVPTDINVTFKLTSFAEDASGAVVYGQTSEVKYENGTRVGA